MVINKANMNVMDNKKSVFSCIIQLVLLVFLVLILAHCRFDFRVLRY